VNVLEDAPAPLVPHAASGQERCDKPDCVAPFAGRVARISRLPAADCLVDMPTMLKSTRILAWGLTLCAGSRC